MKDLDRSLIRLGTDLNEGEVDARRRKEPVVSVSQPAHGVRTSRFPGIPDENLHAGIRTGGIPPDDADIQGFRHLEGELQFGVSLERIERARRESEVAQDIGVNRAG